MRILHLGKFFPPYHGGMERYIGALTEALAGAGVATAVLAHAPPGIHQTSRHSATGVEVTLASCYGQLLYAPISPAFPWQLARLIKSFRPDLLHIHMPNPSAFFALLSPAARRLPWVVQWQSDVPLDARHLKLRWAYRLYRPWEQALLRHADAVIATSSPYRDSSAALAPWLEKVQVIPLALSEVAPQTAPAPQAWPTKGLKILAVGRLAYYKGFDVLLRGLAAVPDASLVLIGGGECAANLHALADRLRISDRVYFAGAVDEAALASAYATADVFCLPSIERSEAFGIVLLEAMRAGLPVLASAVAGSGIGYVVEDGKTGLLLPAGDSSAWADGIKRLAQDPGLRQRLGAAGHARWKSVFSLEKVTAQTLALYRSILARRRNPAAKEPVTSPPQA